MQNNLCCASPGMCGQMQVVLFLFLKHFRDPEEKGLLQAVEEKDERSLLEMLVIPLPPIPSKGWEGSGMAS